MTLSALYQIADDNQIEVYCFPLRNRKAFSLQDGDIVIDADKLESHADEKACVAHELGHCMTGSFYNVYSPLDIRKKHENRAQRWAIKKLLPKQELSEAVENGFCELWELAELFDLPEPFIKEAIAYYKIA